MLSLAACSSDEGDATGSGGTTSSDAGAAGATPGTGGGGGTGAVDGGGVCGDGVLDPGETCDDGNGVTGDGCEADCNRSCTSDADCDDSVLCNGNETCADGADGARSCTAGVPPADGTACGEDPHSICLAAACVASTCGDGFVDTSASEECEPPGDPGCTTACRNAVCGNSVLEPGEECDDGDATAGDGCEPDCTLTCAADTDCDDAEPCNGVETCAPNADGAACVAGTSLAEGASCGTSKYCKSDVCTLAVCGNGVQEPGEACEPPGTSTCSTTCALVVCGDGVIAGNEICDDGNINVLDGCDASCRYEMSMRVTRLAVSIDPVPSYCVYQNNQYGSALSDAAVAGFNQAIQAAVDGGQMNLQTFFWDLDAYDGSDDALLHTLTVGSTVDTRDPRPFTTGGIDHWFIGNQKLVDELASPTVATSSITGGYYTSPSEELIATFLIGSFYHDFVLREARSRAKIMTTPAPDVPLPPPSALASGFRAFVAMSGEVPDTGLCAGLTVDSLAKQPIPSNLTSGTYACGGCTNAPTYTYCGANEPVRDDCNSMLDVLVSGCKASGAVCAPIIKPTQPDIGTDGNPPAVLVADPITAKVTVPNPRDAYSSYFRYYSVRAHITNNLP